MSPWHTTAQCLTGLVGGFPPIGLAGMVVGGDCTATPARPVGAAPNVCNRVP